jgi:hypothetical protein
MGAAVVSGRSCLLVIIGVVEADIERRVANYQRRTGDVLDLSPKKSACCAFPRLGNCRGVPRMLMVVLAA